MRLMLSLTLTPFSLDHLQYILTQTMIGWWFGRCTGLPLLRGFPNLFVGGWGQIGATLWDSSIFLYFT